MNQSEKTPKTLATLDGNTLMAQEFAPLRFSVDKILPHGLFILAGSPKIGKSWLSLDLCQAVATGGRLWDYQAEQGNVLYLALEDNYHRLQNRLKQMEVEQLDISRLHMATASFGLQDGLLEQINNFVAANTGTNLIAIDTLEHIRNGEQTSNLYACDYRDMNRLREITTRWIELIKEYADIQELDTATLQRLIKKIVIHEDLDGDIIRQTVEIHFNFKGQPDKYKLIRE